MIEPHFEAAAELDPAEREAYLARLAAEDAALADDLRSLLDSDGRRLSDLRAEAPDLLAAAGGAPPAVAPDLAERMVGPYRVVRTIGRGGMSVVYLAERVDGKFDQQVALKVMHWTGGVRAVERFRLEQQTLARLDHPSITRIFDSGVTDDGLPYFVMEYVDGEPLTRAAAERRLDVRDRVRLFVRLCGAVHNAHQRLVVHRDLKPDNVLMTRDGHVKVLDFGIAKWLTEGEEDPAAPALTRHGEGLLTPQYAAPEQFLEQPVTTATDVYALGLLLYELLAGALPYELAGRSFTEQRRLVCEESPQPLSARANDPERSRELAGDLETICAKALQKEPARRYDSAAAMASDLRHYLDGLPVSAAPDSAAYRASRFVRRHRVPVAIAAIAAFGLIAAAVTTAWQAQVAARERDHARVEAAQSEEILNFLIGSLEQANPYADGGEALTVRQALDRSAVNVDEELTDLPEVRVRMYTMLCRVFGHVGEMRRAETFGFKAIRLADSLFGRSSVESATARLQTARAVAHSSIDSALTLEREGIAGLEGERDRDSRLMLANLYEDHGMHLEAVGSSDSALALERRALAIRESIYDGPAADLARSHHHLATQLSSMGDPGAGAEFAKAAEMWKQTLSENHPNYASTLNNWAIWLEREGLPDSAETVYRRALAIGRRTLAGQRGLATQLNNIGRLALRRGRVDSARTYLSEAIGLLHASEGSDLPVAAAMTNLGLAAYLQGDYAGAEALYREGRAIFVRLFGPHHVYVAVADSYIGRALWREGRPEEAEKRLTAAIRVFEKHLPAQTPRLVAARTWAGRLWMDTDPERAEKRLRVAVDMARADLPEKSAERGEAEVALGICLARRGAREEGTLLVQEGYRSLLAVHGEQHPMTRWAMAALDDAGPAGTL